VAFAALLGTDDLRRIDLVNLLIRKCGSETCEHGHTGG
jgi:hypothetical protein